MVRIKTITWFVATLLLTLAVSPGIVGCSRQYDARLTRIAEIMTPDPERALAILDSIKPGTLTERDRHYYELLTIKANDKAYITHKSDSLILEVLRYYEANPSDPVYNEALYYAGRVYADIGDYPTALQYYRKALDNTGQTPDISDLRSRILSQTGSLLEELRLYEEAIPYYMADLKQAAANRDSLSIAYAQRSIGSAYYNLGTMADTDSLRNSFLETADSILTRSFDFSGSFPQEFIAESRILLAAVRQEKGDMISSVNLVRHTPDQVRPAARNFALAYAADIYREAGIMDTAYMYAHELVVNENLINKKTGYRILLSPEFRHMIHPDTLNRYYTEYKDVLESYFDDNRNELALIQHGQYNYNLHERQKEETQKSNERLKWTVALFIAFTLVLIIVLLYLRYRYMATIVQLRSNLDALEDLKVKLDNRDDRETEGNREDQESFNQTPGITKTSLRERLREELTALCGNPDDVTVPDEILTSEIYARVLDRLDAGKCIDDGMLDELKKVVLTVSPKFISNLQILTQNQMTKLELHTALLTKCGFKPSDMNILLGRSNGAIISRKKTLGAKVLGRKESVTVISAIIRRL